MKEDLFDDIYEEKEKKKDFKTVLFSYLIHWPWFVAAIIACLCTAYLYLRYTPSVYNIQASVLIKEEKKSGSGTGAMEALADLGFMTSADNIDNEVEILHSKSLIRDVVTELKLYTTYMYKGRIGKVELYGSSPVTVDMDEADLQRLKEPVSVEILLAPGSALPDSIATEAGMLAVTYNPDMDQTEDERVIIVTIAPPMQVAKAYGSALTVEATSKTTSILAISLESTNKQRGEDFVNKLIEVYNRNANNDKNEIAQKTALFINERIGIISRELGTTEDELATFKQNAGLTDLTSNAQLTLTENSEYEKKRVENGTQLNLIDYLTEYISNPANRNTVLPVNVGLADESLSGLISKYNDLILERNRLLRTSSEKNPAIAALNGNIQSMLANISTTIGSVRKGLLITQKDIEREAGKYTDRISNAPIQERRLVSISRQQEIKASLYLMLLQKREENSIALAATADNARVIDTAMADEIPVSPKRSVIWLLALIFGIGIPFGVIYLIKVLSFRISSHEEVERLTGLPIIGDIPLSEEKKAIAVEENNNDLMAEIFRGVRSNLLFSLNGNDRKVVMVTSTVSGEGKTFIASNLAMSLALLGKKVVLVGLDIRKPGLNKVFSLPHKITGITQYLSAPQETDLMSLLLPSGMNPNLQILAGGIVPPNPTELLAREALPAAIDILRRHFDYVVLDTAPIGMVTDTLMIARTADVTVYVCRADYSHKSNLELVNELVESNKFSNVSIVINGIDMNKKKYGYYYGYGKYGKYGQYYGYGKKYGYGYGYGNSDK